MKLEFTHEEEAFEQNSIPLLNYILKYAEKIAAKNNVKFQINIRFKKHNDWNIK